MNTTASNTPPQAPAFASETRPLGEEVLQSAEEAALSQAAVTDSRQGDEARGREVSAGQPLSWSDRLAHCVAEKPARSALLALGTGALLTMLCKSALKKRRMG